ncbi:hypothetical protein GCM10027168_74330 [Streptomyces capparidis]
MALFRVERSTALPAATAWRRLTRWERHSAHVPLTSVTVRTPPPTRVGTRLLARTGRGAAAFDDPMEVVRWEPPDAGGAGRCLLAKRGRVVLGRVGVEVLPRGAGCLVVWWGELRVRGLPRALDAAVGRSARLMYGRLADGLLREP